MARRGTRVIGFYGEDVEAPKRPGQLALCVEFEGVGPDYWQVVLEEQVMRERGLSVSVESMAVIRDRFGRFASAGKAAR